MVDVENIKHIAENKRLIGDMMEKTAADWKSQKELFYEQTGFSHLPVAAPPNEEENDYYRPQTSNEDIVQADGIEGHDQSHEHQEDNDFDKELEFLLFEP